MEHQQHDEIKQITLYDVASGLKPQASSPSTWRARYILNYKRLPYKTVYVSYPDIDALWIRLGLSPMDQGPNRPKTFLPVISVPSEDGGPPSVIADSINIAIFLDAEYPDTPRVLPPNTRALQIAFAQNVVISTLAPAIFPFILPRMPATLDPRGAEYYKSTREKWFNIQLDEYYPRSPEAFQAQLDKIHGALDVINRFLEYNRQEGMTVKVDGATSAMEAQNEWVMGSFGPTFADFGIGALLLWVRIVCRDENETEATSGGTGESVAVRIGAGKNEVWEKIATWHGGRWARLTQALEQWKTVD